MVAKLLVVGGGKMGSALVSGLLSSKWATGPEIALVEPSPDRRRELAALFPRSEILDVPEELLAGQVGGALLAVKPEVAEGACRVLGAVGVTRVLSVVAGLSTSRLEESLGRRPVVVRAMPNVGALVGAGITAMAGGSHVTGADLEWAEGILAAVGPVVRVPERELDAVTGLSGSGPAYVFVVAEALIEAGVLAGLTRELSRQLVVRTLLGSATLLEATGETPEALRASVTSPGGTTAAGLRALEARGVRSAFLEAVLSATERSRQLGR